MDLTQRDLFGPSGPPTSDYPGGDAREAEPEPLSESGPPSGTVAEARNALRAGWLQGRECPCCNQLVKLYRRPLTASMARVLLGVFAADEERRSGRVLPASYATADGTYHLGRLITERPGFSAAVRGGGDASKLRFWGLLFPVEGEREDGSRRNGWWRLTERGRRFCQGALAVPQYVFIFNDTAYSPEAAGVPEEKRGGLVTLRDVMGEGFDYAEMMGALRGVRPAGVRRAA